MRITDWTSLLAFLISAATAVGSLRAYSKYGRRLNEQQAQINEYILAQQDEEELKSRCADLKFKINANRLIVKNSGQAEAKDIQLIFPSPAIISPQEFPVTIKSISAGANFQVRIRRATTSLKGIDVLYSWIDGRGIIQKGAQHVSLD